MTQPRTTEPTETELRESATWLALDLPAMRAIVRSENPNMSKAEIAIEAIRRLG